MKNRDSIYVPGTVQQMKDEAARLIDPAVQEPIEPSWQADGLAFIDESDPGHFLARHLVALGGELDQEPDPVPRSKFDSRLFFDHPLECRYFPLPTFPAASEGAPDAYLNKKEVNVSGGAAPTPVSSDKAWYNKDGAAVHFMGRIGDFRDPDFQKFLTAANKRMVRHWMGELLAMTDQAQQPALRNWFATDEGKRHFGHWCQMVAPHIGYRPPKNGKPQGAHTAGNGADLNYEFNPWCPVFNSEDNRMIGEDNSKVDSNNAVGRIYDRALRVFVPKTGTDANAQAADLARKYYRNHWDWTPDTVQQIYQNYQILNWSLQFYFDILYRRARYPKYLCDFTISDDGEHALPAGTSPAYRCDISCDNNQDTDIRTCTIRRPRPTMRTAREVWDALAAKIGAGHLPADSAVLCEAGVVPAAVRSYFTAVQLTYPFSQTRTQLQFALTQAGLDAVPDADREAVGRVIAAQIKQDHATLRPQLNSSAGDRDPCRGVFNHSYEMVLAFGRMLTDARMVRTFGTFVSGAAADMQHFDYGYRPRF